MTISPKRLTDKVQAPRRRGRVARRGTAAVELAILLPLIVTLLFGIWEVGRLIDVQHLLTNAAREGGRQASTGLLGVSSVQTVVVSYLQDAGLPTQNVVVNVDNLTAPGVSPRNAAQLDRFQITVSIPFADVRWIALNRFMTPAGLVTGQATWCSFKDKDYPTPPGAPPGW
jgi:Flp pilus assembly protein TadG